MKRPIILIRDSRGAAVVEFALAVPVLITFVWGLFQLCLVFMADAGMQHALGEAARLATIYPTPSDDVLKAKITSTKFGPNVGGTWAQPVVGNAAADGSKTITVTYTQPLNFLFFQGPNVTMTRSKTIFISK